MKENGYSVDMGAARLLCQIQLSDETQGLDHAGSGAHLSACPETACSGQYERLHHCVCISSETVLFFLHHYENRLNVRVRRFLLRDGLDRHDPERFWGCKMGCVLVMAGLSVGSFENVGAYKAVHGIAWLCNQSGQSDQEAAQKYARKNGCIAETGEDVTRDDSWSYADILRNSIQAEAIQEALAKLNCRKQRLWEKRNAICMTRGRISPRSTRLTFAELAVLFVGSTASGAERAHCKAVWHLACLLTKAGGLHHDSPET